MTTRRAFDDARGFDEVLRRNVDMDFSFRLLACGYALALVPDAIAIKHHDLTQRQAIRRGWDGGLSASLVDKRWAPRVPRAATRRLDALKGWTRQALLQRPSLGAARALAVLEQTSKLAGYAYAELAHSRLAPSRYEAVTDLPRVLGGRRSLVLYSGEALLFDAGQRRRHHLDRLRAHAVTCFIDGVSDPDVIGRRLVERFGVSAEAARAGVDAATRLLSD